MTKIPNSSHLHSTFFNVLASRCLFHDPICPPCLFLRFLLFRFLFPFGPLKLWLPLCRLSVKLWLFGPSANSKPGLLLCGCSVKVGLYGLSRELQNSRLVKLFVALLRGKGWSHGSAWGVAHRLSWWWLWCVSSNRRLFRLNPLCDVAYSGSWRTGYCLSWRTG